VKPILEFRLPRLYVFIILMVAMFSILNVAILFYGPNLYIYYSAIWTWSIILLMALVGAMLIGMAISHRLFTFREFTPFEKDMMEMRVEVDECMKMIEAIHDHIKEKDGDELTEAVPPALEGPDEAD
jgi:small-conductance mechanosensitive channel